MLKISILVIFVIIFLPVLNADATSFQTNNIEQFENWAHENGISLVGVNKSSYDLYYSGYDPKTDYVNWKDVPRVLIVADALYKIPPNVIQVMNGKTIYFSTENGRSYTVLGSFPEYGILEGLERGIILEQNINAHTVIHEIGHIVDYHGIQGIYNDDQNIFGSVFDDRNSIFNGLENLTSYTITDGYISKYSTVNDAENFAENFAYYILYQNEFRERLKVDPLLIEEYEFMSNQIFN